MSQSRKSKPQWETHVDALIRSVLKNIFNYVLTHSGTGYLRRYTSPADRWRVKVGPDAGFIRKRTRRRL
jgi:hypothetical protein